MDCTGKFFCASRLVAAALGVIACLCSCQRGEHPASAAPEKEDPPVLGVRVSMERLHAWGGIPPGWKFTPPRGDPEAGRKAFVELGCFKCHRVAGENFPAVEQSLELVGPDLTGMGDHHPPGYFAEAIVNPNAVLVDGPGYLDDHGGSRMPMYPDMTLEQLTDLVAYLTSLKEGAPTASAQSGGAKETTRHQHHHEHGVGGSFEPDRLSYFAQVFEVEEEQIDAFYRWFDARGFEQIPGLARIDTYASRERHEGRQRVVVLFGFENDGALEAFRKNKNLFPLGSFVRPVERFLLEGPPVYRATQMSIP